MTAQDIETRAEALELLKRAKLIEGPRSNELRRDALARLAPTMGTSSEALLAPRQEFAEVQ